MTKGFVKTTPLLSKINCRYAHLCIYNKNCRHNANFAFFDSSFVF